MKLIESLNWRYATKKFDTTKKIDPNDLEYLKEAIRLSASSFGLQLYKVLVIEDLELRKQLQEASFNQPQVSESSHLIVFCNYTKVNDNDIDKHINLTASTRKIDAQMLKGYGDFMKGTIGNFSEEQTQVWTAKQTYLATGNLLAAAGELKIDACPMEGFDAKKYNKILNLNKDNLNAALIVPVGYRSTEDQTQHLTKVRKATENLFVTL